MKSIKGWGPRGRAVAVGVLFLLMALIPMLKSSENANAGSGSYVSDATLDGWIKKNDTVYPPVLTTTVNTVESALRVGQSYASGGYSVWRSFISFDTSTIPLGAVIDSVILRLYLFIDGSTTDFDVQVYGSNFTTLEDGDWTYYSGFQGTLLSTAGATINTWYQVALSPDYVNLSGPTQYTLVSSRDGIAPTSSEQVLFRPGDGTNKPTLEITYSMRCTIIHIERTGSRWLNQTAYPNVQEWNLTYELDEYQVDSVPDSVNITFDKQETTWTFRGVSPGCNYTDDPTFLRLEDVFDSITYRVWFTVPKINPYSTVHLSLYNSFTGEGYFWEQMKVQMSDGSSWDNATAQTITKPDFFVEPNATYTLRILDFFGNTLTDYSFVANAENIYLQVAVPYYSWQIFNMNDAPILMRIYWNNSGSPWEFFVGPHWIIERFLKGGDYTFMTTFYDTTGVAGSTVYFNRTVPMIGLNASFVYVNGTTLYEVITSIEGVMAVQQIITSLVSPSMVLIYENLPLAPVQIRTLSMSTRIAIDPYLILEATTYQNQTGIALASTALWLPHPDSLGCSYYILADTLTFSGTFATTIYVNDTTGTNLYYNTILPAAIQLDGQNVTVWADQAYSVSRATTWREVSEYTVNYYSTQRKYEAVVSLNNSCPFDYYAPYWYVAFPQNTTIDQDTVTVYDLDNAITLTQRTNFDVTAGGIHVTLTRLNSSDVRNFRLSYWDANGSSNIGAPNLIAEAYSQGTLNGVSMKYTSVQWMNPYSVSYVGEVYITLNFSEGDNLLRSSITIIDETTGNAIPNSQYVYTGRTILILTDGVGTVQVGGARNYGIYFTLDAEKAPTKTDFFFGPIVWKGSQFWIAGYAVSWMLILLIIGWAGVVWRYWTDDKHHDAFSFFIIWGSVSVIMFYFQSVMM